MPSLSEKDRANLMAGIEAISKIQSFTKDTSDAEMFFENTLVFDATLMNFVLLGEVVSKISQETQDTYPKVPWRLVKDFRNIIAHNYFGVDAEEVWEIIQKHLDPLKNEFETILSA